MRKISGQIHLWLGLLSGLVVFIVSITGCIFVFEEELFNLTHRDAVYVLPAHTMPRSLSELRLIAQEKLGAGKRINNVEIYADPARTYIFSASKNNKEQGWNYFQRVSYWEELYINQYTGDVTGIVNKEFEFFNVVRRLHQHLLLRNEVGSMIVGSCCLMFLVLLITGFILWFPKGKAGWRQRFTINWKARWRRVNYDSHNVGGFYVLPVAIVIVVTGLVWSFDWWEAGIYRMLGDNEKPRVMVEQSETIAPSPVDPIDIALQTSLTKDPEFQKLSFSFPEKKTQPLRVSMSVGIRSGWQASNAYYYHSVTGDPIKEILQEDKTLGTKWRNSNYGIHTGGIYGLPTKILAFFASFICASLPVTGFYIWWGKRKKVVRKTKVNAAPGKMIRPRTAIAKPKITAIRK